MGRMMTHYNAQSCAVSQGSQWSGITIVKVMMLTSEHVEDKDKDGEYDDNNQRL